MLKTCRKYILLSILTFFIADFSFSQNVKVNFSKIDAYAISVKGINDPGKLSKKLTSPYKTDLEKARSIFRWIAENIAYDTKEFHSDSAHSIHYKIYKDIDMTVKNPDNEFNLRLSEYVLKNKKGICEGYAALFKVLCDSANLKAEIINGIAKNSVKNIGTAMSENHAWNAIFLDNKWQLLDATWASGSCNDSITKFTKKYDDCYFLTLPNKMIINHFPTNSKWFLFPNPPTRAQFLSYPLAYAGYFENSISSYTPANGIIEAKPGNKISFSINMPAESSAISVSSRTGNNDVNIKKQEKIVTYEYVVSSDKDDELTIYMNNEAVFSYRIVTLPKQEDLKTASK
ncbi:MAG: transglutaminase domain-containing protein [Bacteroidia bacterium]